MYTSNTRSDCSAHLYVVGRITLSAYQIRKVADEILLSILSQL